MTSVIATTTPPDPGRRRSCAPRRRRRRSPWRWCRAKRPRSARRSRCGGRGTNGPLAAKTTASRPPRALGGGVDERRGTGGRAYVSFEACRAHAERGDRRRDGRRRRRRPVVRDGHVGAGRRQAEGDLAAQTAGHRRPRDNGLLRSASCPSSVDVPTRSRSTAAPGGGPERARRAHCIGPHPAPPSSSRPIVGSGCDRYVTGPPRPRPGGPAKPPQSERDEAMKETIDALDKGIITQLCEDGGRSTAEMATRLGVSNPTIRSRVRALLERGVLRLAGRRRRLRGGRPYDGARRASPCSTSTSTRRSSSSPLSTRSPGRRSSPGVTTWWSKS